MRRQGELILQHEPTGCYRIVFSLTPSRVPSCHGPARELLPVATGATIRGLQKHAT